jgi:hypothetical protein
MRAFLAIQRDWLVVERLPAYAPDLRTQPLQVVSKAYADERSSDALAVSLCVGAGDERQSGAGKTS